MKSEIKSDVPNSNRKLIGNQCPKSDRMVRNQIRNHFWNSNNINIKDLKSEIKSDVPNSNRKLIENSVRNPIEWSEIKSEIKSDVPNLNRKQCPNEIG